MISHGLHRLLVAARPALLAASVLLALLACSSIECPIQNTVYTVYNVTGEGEAADTLTDTLTIFTLRHDQTDTLLLYNRGTALTTFNLPISYNSPEDTLFFLRWGPQAWAVDTVWIKKDDLPHFESVDCSAAFFHEITAVRSTHYGIDTIIINNPTVNYDPSTEHFHIRFKDLP